MAGSLYQQVIQSVLGLVGLGGVEQVSAVVIESSADALVAHAGGGQALGTPITTNFARVTTVVTAGDSMTLPKALAGTDIVLVNAAAANSMNVFPAVGEGINALANDSAFAMAANKTALFNCVVNGKWNVILTA